MITSVGRASKLALALAGAMLLGGGALVGVWALQERSDTAESRRPNVVLVMADDMRPDEMERVADLKPDGGFAWVRDHGLRFPKLWSTNNLCCPGKTTVLTGQTTYNHEVFSNEYFDIQNSLPLWLRQAGYCTGYTGKYLNGYDETEPRPAGWTYWEPLVTFADEYGFDIVQRDGTLASPGDVFITDYLAEVSRAQLDDCLDSRRPAFVSLWPFAPHIYSDPAPEYANVPVTWSNPDPTFNEVDISDKPGWLQRAVPTQRPALDEAMAEWNRLRVRPLLSVDDALKGLIDDLARRGALNDTLVVLTSDNGYLMGEHRLDNAKRMAYEAAQPALWIAGPGFPSGASSGAYAMNIDVAPTVLRATGAVARDLVVDGRDLQGVLAEADLGHDRFLPLYVFPENAPNRNFFLPQGEGVRTWRYKYLRYADGSEELYDLGLDPHEDANVAGDPGYVPVKTAMIALLEKAKTCAGDDCRAGAPADLRR